MGIPSPVVVEVGLWCALEAYSVILTILFTIVSGDYLGAGELGGSREDSLDYFLRELGETEAE